MLLRPLFAPCLRKNLNLTSNLNSFDTGEGTVEGMSTMATPVQPKVQVEQKKGSPVGTKMGSSPGHMHTSLCCRYSSAQFKHQPGHSCRLGSHLSSSWNKWLLTQPCWVNTRLTTHTGCPVCRLWQHRNTFICSHMPPRSHTEFSRSVPSPGVSSVVSLFAQKHCVNLHSAQS